MISILLCSLIASTPTLEYSEIYEEVPESRTSPRLSLSSSYAYGFTDQYSDLHSIAFNGQIRLWKYLSTGVFYQHLFPQVSEAGERLETNLEPLLDVKIPQSLWGAFSLTQIQFIVGRWNLLNLTELDVELLVGGGLGVLNQRADRHLEGKNSVSYLWHVEQRSSFSEHLGISLSIFGHKGGSFLAAGMIFKQ